ncbi:MAG: hypothetical protein ACKOC5_19580, partial [Chloroflexota bacterium]
MSNQPSDDPRAWENDPDAGFPHIEDADPAEPGDDSAYQVTGETVNLNDTQVSKVSAELVRRSQS